MKIQLRLYLPCWTAQLVPLGFPPLHVLAQSCRQLSLLPRVPAPQTQAHSGLWFAMALALPLVSTHILHSTLFYSLHSSAQHHGTDSTSQCFDLRFPEGRMRLSSFGLINCGWRESVGVIYCPLGTWIVARFNG